MSVLQVAQRAALRCGLEVPSVFFTNQTRTWQEMQVLVNDCARQILDEYDWQALKKVATITGDGVLTEFPMPDDYDRMVRDAHMWTNFTPFWNAQQVSSVDSWLAMEESGFFSMVVPVWIIFGNLFHVRPALDTPDTLKYFYVSKFVVSDAGSPVGISETFTADTQSFVLDERLLTHCLVYNWKMAKGLDYSADLQQYEDDMAYAIGKDKGPRVIQEGRGTRVGAWQGGWPFNGTWT
jgi:hypothetical protein